MDRSLEGTIKFVQLIQKHPVIYDRNRNCLDLGIGAFNAAWNDVAHQSGDSLQQCKQRWNTLKCLYGKYLKKMISQMTPHGIEPYLSFLTPIIMPASVQGKLEDCLEFNVKLVNLVRKRPCLYNGSQFNSKPEFWQEIAEQLQKDYAETLVTAERCQRRWSALRFAFDNGHQFRPLGIEEHLAFLTPHLHPSMPVKVNLFLSDKRLIELVKNRPCLYDGTASPKFDAWKEVAYGMGKQSTPQKCLNRWLELRHAFQRHLLDGSAMYPRGIEQQLDFLEPYMDVQEEEPETKMRRTMGHIPFDTSDQDVQFVINFVETMREMNDAQKRQFRVGAVRLTREILGE